MVSNNILIKSEDLAIKQSDKFTTVVIFVAAFLTFIVQLLTHSLPLGALVGLGVIFSLKIIPKNKMDTMMNEGIYLMGYIAFVMLVAAGFAAVLKESGAIETLVYNTLPLLPQNILLTLLSTCVS